MKKTIIGLLFCLSGILYTSLPAGAGERLVVLYTNDTHSQIEPLDNTQKNADMGGVVRRKAIIDSIRAAEPHVLLVDAGDIVQGTPYFTLFKGKAEVTAMNIMGYNVCTFGNHEFDNGVEALAEMVRQSNADYVSANYDFSRTPLAGLVKPYVLKTFGKLKVGIFGLTVDPDGLIASDRCEGVQFTDPIEAANRTAAQLKKEGADLVIALSHLGYTKANEADRLVTDPELAAASADIDIIIGGHSHTLIDPKAIDSQPDPKTPYRIKNRDGKEVIITQTGSTGAYFGKLTIEL